MGTLPQVGEAPASPPVVIDGVAVVGWPDAAASTPTGPRLVVLADDAAPPLTWGDDEDWVRPDASPVEVAARAARLAARRDAGVTVTALPVLDADGILRAADGRWRTIPPVEARLLAALLATPRRAVHREDLIRAAWPHGDVGERSLDGRVKLLRRRIADFGLSIHTVRGVGYLLEPTGHRMSQTHRVPPGDTCTG